MSHEVVEKNINLTTHLSLEQEIELVSDIKLLLMAHFLISKLEFSYIIQTYDSILKLIADIFCLKYDF